jgi:hypothetical protein
VRHLAPHAGFFFSLPRACAGVPRSNGTHAVFREDFDFPFFIFLGDRDRGVALALASSYSSTLVTSTLVMDFDSYFSSLCLSLFLSLPFSLLWPAGQCQILALIHHQVWLGKRKCRILRLVTARSTAKISARAAVSRSAPPYGSSTTSCGR